jgi:lipopolysaccharide export system protein LptA
MRPSQRFGLLTTCVIAAAASGVLSVQSQPARESEPKSRPSAVLPGGNSKQPINIQSASLDYFDKEQKLVYSGNVVAVQGDSKLKCSTLVIYLPPKAEGQASSSASTSQVQHMDATGPVTMISKDQIGTGDHGVYDKASDTVVLTGNVTLSQCANVTKGDRLVYLLKTGHATVTGTHVVSMFEPENSSGSCSKK